MGGHQNRDIPYCMLSQEKLIPPGKNQLHFLSIKIHLCGEKQREMITVAHCLCPPQPLFSPLLVPSSVFPPQLLRGSEGQQEPARTGPDPPEAALRSPHADPRPHCRPRDLLPPQSPPWPVQGVFRSGPGQLGHRRHCQWSGCHLQPKRDGPWGCPCPRTCGPGSWAHTGEDDPAAIWEMRCTWRGSWGAIRVWAHLVVSCPYPLHSLSRMGFLII